jgi:hypothetical protein
VCAVVTDGYGCDVAITRHERIAAVGLGAVVLASLTGCAQQQESAVASVASDFVGAVQDHDGRQACNLLSPAARSELEQSAGKPCEQGILEEHVGGGSVRAVTVFDTMAQVRLEGSAVFLSHFDSGWLVTAAACNPIPDRPYDCSIQG